MANVPSEYLYLANTNSMKLQGNGDLMFPKVSHDWISLNNYVTSSVPFGNTSWCGAWLYDAHSSEQSEVAVIDVMVGPGIITINVVGDDNGETGATVTYSHNIPNTAVRYTMSYRNSTPSIGYRPTTNVGTYKETNFPRLREALEYIYTHWTGINLYVNGDHWLNYDVNGFVIDYTWQSVPSISGKNGILLLSTIQSVYLNNGDPVNDALESYIDFIDDSKVAVLVEQEIDDLTKVTVKYVVPAGTYEYIKLVYKVGSAPTSVTDGTAVDILQAAKKVILSGIADGSTYFFKIFTDITESEPYEFTTVRPVGDNFFTIDLSSDGRDTMRYNASKTIHVQVDSIYSMHDVDYYAAQGALADPTSPSNPTYTISNGEVTTANNSHCLCWAYAHSDFCFHRNFDFMMEEKEVLIFQKISTDYDFLPQRSKKELAA